MSRQELLVGRASFPLDDGPIARALAWVSASHVRAIAALVLISLVCFLPGIASIPPLDRDEARFAQSTKQMLETGNYIDIRLGDEARYKKPIGIYWLQAALVKATGQGADAPISAYRLASLAGALATVLLTYWAALAFFGRPAAFIGAALMALSLILVVEAHLAKTDAVLTATVTLAMGALGRLYMRKDSHANGIAIPLLFWVGTGLGILVKGPIAPMVAALAIVALVATDRRAAWLKRLRPAIGLPVMLAIVLPWFIAILAIAGRDFFQQSVGADLLSKVASGQESHGAPPGTHFATFWVIFWPGAVLAPFAATWVWHRRAEPAVHFCLAWIVPSWIVFELVATKLPHYTLPLYPAIAMLIGGAVANGSLSAWPRLARIAAMPPAAFAVLLALAAVVGLAWLQHAVSPTLLVLLLVVAGLAAMAMIAGRGHAPLTAAALVAVAAAGAYWAVLGIAAPRLDVLHVSGALAAAATRDARCLTPEIASAGYDEPSLLFLAGTGTRFVDGPAAADFLAAGGCRVVFVAAPRQAAFLARVADLGLAVDKRDTVEGIDIGNLNRVSIAVYVPVAATAQ